MSRDRRTDMQAEGQPDLRQLMEQALAMRDRFSALRGELDTVELTGSAGNGQVVVTVRGTGEPVGVRIDTGVVDPHDVPALARLVEVARVEAQRAIQVFAKERTRIV